MARLGQAETSTPAYSCYNPPQYCSPLNHSQTVEVGGSILSLLCPVSYLTSTKEVWCLVSCFKHANFSSLIFQEVREQKLNMLVEAHQDVYHQGQLYSHPTPEPGPSVRAELNQRSDDILTYSQYVNGSVFTIPKIWSQQNTDDLLVAVYSFVKTYIG